MKIQLGLGVPFIGCYRSQLACMRNSPFLIFKQISFSSTTYFDQYNVFKHPVHTIVTICYAEWAEDTKATQSTTSDGFVMNLKAHIVQQGCCFFHYSHATSMTN